MCRRGRGRGGREGFRDGDENKGGRDKKKKRQGLWVMCQINMKSR